VDKKRRQELDLEQELELVIGPHAFGSAFPSDDVRRAAWEAHRETLSVEFPLGCWAAREYDREDDPDEDAAPWR
jgi:hypothetical protein